MPNLNGKRTAADIRRSIENAGRQLAALARDRSNARELLRTDLHIPQESRPLLIAQHDVSARKEREQHVALIRDMLAEFRGAAVLAGPPSPRPSSAAESGWLAAIATAAVHYSPAVMTKAIRDATANGDRALLGVLLPLATSYQSYRKEFQADQSLFDAVRLAEPVAVSDAERESSAAAKWADGVDRDLRSLDVVLSSDRPTEHLDAYLSLNALPSLLPSQPPGPYTAEAQAAQHAAQAMRAAAQHAPLAPPQRMSDATPVSVPDGTGV